MTGRTATHTTTVRIESVRVGTLIEESADESKKRLVGIATSNNQFAFGPCTHPATACEYRDNGDGTANLLTPMAEVVADAAGNLFAVGALFPLDATSFREVRDRKAREIEACLTRGGFSKSDIKIVVNAYRSTP